MSLYLHYLYLDSVIAPKQTHKILVRELTKTIYPHGRRGGLMVSDLVSGSSCLGSSPGQRHCVVFLGKTLHRHSASLHPGVIIGAGEFNAGGQPCDGLASHSC